MQAQRPRGNLLLLDVASYLIPGIDLAVSVKRAFFRSPLVANFDGSCSTSCGRYFKTNSKDAMIAMSKEASRGEQLTALRKLKLEAVRLDSASVSPGVIKAVLRCIDDQGPTCWASIATIASEVCFDVRTTQRAVQALLRLGLIREIPTDKKTNEYTIIWKAVIALATPVTVTPPSQCHPVTKSGTPVTQTRNPRHSDTQSESEPRMNRNNNGSDRFEEFWEAFPKQRRISRKAAQRKWAHAIKTVNPQVLIDRAKEYAGSYLGRSEFACAPAKWLEDERWLDDPAAWQRQSTDAIGKKPDPSHKKFNTQRRQYA